MSVKIVKCGNDTLLRVDSAFWLAEIALSVNANLIRLQHRKSGLELLRQPESMDALHAKPEVYGIPLLFPPNRIDGGKFKWNGRDYSFPLNEPGKGNHIHGLVLGRPFTLEKAEEKGDEVLIEMSFDFDSRYDVFTGFPHEFRLCLSYRFKGDELMQHVSLTNRSPSAMPFGLGFHTAFHLPFGDQGKAEPCKIMIPSGQGYWETSPERRLPTGRLIDWPEDERFNSGDGQLFSNDLPIARHFPLAPDMPFSGAIIDSPGDGMRLVYEFDEQYKHCAIWNDGGGKGFFCVEPMTWMTNAPNLKLEAGTTGFQSLAPGGLWQARSSIKTAQFNESMERTHAAT